MAKCPPKTLKPGWHPNSSPCVGKSQDCGEHEHGFKSGAAEHENLHTTFMRALFLAAREHGYDLEGGIQFMPTSEINRSGVIRIQTDLLLVPHMK